MAGETSSITENLLGSSDTFSDRSVSSLYVNPIDPDAMSSSPPPSYRRVLEEDKRLRESFEEQTAGNTDDARREGDEVEEKADAESDQELLSESSLWQDQQEASTSFDASSCQFDGDSVSTLPISQLEDCEQPFSLRDYDRGGGQGNKRNKKKDKKEKYTRVMNKSSKVIYAALAKELGLSCMMTENCRCIDCQCSYLQCTENDVQVDTNTDGGLGAGTPMFVSEAFGHAMAPGCTIL